MLKVDCDAARQAAGTERAPSPSAVVDSNVELGTVYTENPLHGQLMVPNNHLDVGDSGNFKERFHYLLFLYTYIVIFLTNHISN